MAVEILLGQKSGSKIFYLFGVYRSLSNGTDKRGIKRGHCTECECEEYEYGAIRYDYCGHTPLNHVPLDPLPKRPRYDEALTGEGSDEVPVTHVEDDASAGQGTTRG